MALPHPGKAHRRSTHPSTMPHKVTSGARPRGSFCSDHYPAPPGRPVVESRHESASASRCRQPLPSSQGTCPGVWPRGNLHGALPEDVERLDACLHHAGCPCLQSCAPKPPGAGLARAAFPGRLRIPTQFSPYSVVSFPDRGQYAMGECRRMSLSMGTSFAPLTFAPSQASSPSAASKRPRPERPARMALVSPRPRVASRPLRQCGQRLNLLPRRWTRKYLPFHTQLQGSSRPMSS